MLLRRKKKRCSRRRRSADGGHAEQQERDETGGQQRRRDRAVTDQSADGHGGHGQDDAGRRLDGGRGVRRPPQRPGELQHRRGRKGGRAPHARVMHATHGLQAGVHAGQHAHKRIFHGGQPLAEPHGRRHGQRDQQDVERGRRPARAVVAGLPERQDQQARDCGRR